MTVGDASQGIGSGRGLLPGFGAAAGTPPLSPEIVEAIADGVGGPGTVLVFPAYVAGYPAVVRDEPPALGLIDDHPVDIRATIWRAYGFAPVTLGRLPGRLDAAWMVRIRGTRVIGVDTQLDPDTAALIGCDWIGDDPDGYEVPDAWVTATREHGTVMLISADLGLDPDQADETELLAALTAAATGGRLLAGLATLDYRDR